VIARADVQSTRQLHEEIMARKLLLAQISSGSNAVSIRDDDEVLGSSFFSLFHFSA
jgi:hypothetical protein